MADKLLIVESPAKANTIKKFLGGSTKVLATMGHIRDLPKSKLGINVEKDFDVDYINIRGKGDLIKQLKKEAKNAKMVYLATDPDREGEAIAWHLAHILEIPDDKVCRVTFNEITKETVRNAIKNPRKIDRGLVDAQQARRVIDRIVGYQISPLLWKKVKRGLSAGRVQSVAVKLIVEKEEEIEKFVSEEYWNIYADLKVEKSKKIIQAKFYGDSKNKIELKNKQQVDEILKKINNGKYIVNDIKQSEKRKNPAPPFTTSTMQQEASRKLNFTLKRTMSIAQNLYEGVNVANKGTVGLITYMRTDSTRISDEARAAVKEHIISNYGMSYYENRYYKTKNNAQDAHEAIRPTYIDLEPDKIKDSLTTEQYKLYKLIYNRFVASQMATAIYDTMAIDVKVNDYIFKANGQKLKFKGFMAVYVETEAEEEDSENVVLLELKNNQELELKKIDSKQSFTEPPARYTEATLVKSLEEKGIGRPSTYSPTITTILERRYIEKIKKQLYATELGKIVNKILIDNFTDIFDVKFTAKIEEQFDEIAEGNEEWKKLVREFYNPFSVELARVEKELEHVVIEDEVSDVPCDKCGRMMVYKYGRYGKFLACPGFPECRNAKPIIETIDVPCPACGGVVQIRKTKRKKLFYICENNPGTCTYISWNKPKVGEKWNPENIIEIKETSKE
ncbi:MAG: type I DNA topoisomerase [Clostridiales bacterium]|nr:type I DNA topoisomerase [Clostridiales bacterium]